MQKPEIDILNLKLNRKGFGTRAEIREVVNETYHSELIRDIKRHGFSKTFGRITVHLAKEFGFCYGVDRAVELAYETCETFPNKKIYLTTEIIHNPTVNKDLMQKGVMFLSGPYQNAKIDDVTKDDIVIIPAFGTTVTEIRDLYAKGCHLVDTICGSVITVWKRVEKYAEEGFTSLIHGKAYHEETMATSSRVLEIPGGQYLVVLNEAEAKEVCDYIVNGGDREKFLEKFKDATSPGFDPDLHLKKMGCANQTTMLSSESLHIANLVKKSFEKRFGADKIDEHFRSFDTICSATQERQDAILDLKNQKLDLFLVVGGFNSSNTTHLNEIALSSTKSYHIDNVDCLIDENTIQHKPLGQKQTVESKDWLPKGEISLGITAGASTPNKVMGEVLERVLKFQ